VLNDGRKITYALGVVVTNENGLRKVAHGGSTAGYQTFLSRYPDLKLSLAVMCNAASRNASGLERDIFREIAKTSPTAPDTIDLKPEELQKYVALFRDDATHIPMRTVYENGALRWEGGVFRPLRDGAFQSGSMRFRFKMGPNGKPMSAEIDNGGEATSRLTAEPEWSATPDELKSFAGIWHSDEADASFTIEVDGGKAFLVQRPATRRMLRTQYKDHFTVGSEMVIWFTRDTGGRVTKLHVGASRMRDMPFERVGVK
jgi:hypothetical protein